MKKLFAAVISAVMVFSMATMSFAAPVISAPSTETEVFGIVNVNATIGLDKMIPPLDPATQIYVYWDPAVTWGVIEGYPVNEINSPGEYRIGLLSNAEIVRLYGTPAPGTPKKVAITITGFERTNADAQSSAVNDYLGLNIVFFDKAAVNTDGSQATPDANPTITTADTFLNDGGTVGTKGSQKKTIANVTNHKSTDANGAIWSNPVALTTAVGLAPGDEINYTFTGIFADEMPDLDHAFKPEYKMYIHFEAGTTP